MTTITVDLDDAKATALQGKAEEYGLPLSRLVAASIEDLLRQEEPDFERAMKCVLSENHELYRRLS